MRANASPLALGDLDSRGGAGHLGSGLVESPGRGDGEGGRGSQGVTPGRSFLLVASKGVAGVSATHCQLLIRAHWKQTVACGEHKRREKKKREIVQEADITCEAAAESV